jgi:hypothetical protein
MIVKVQNRSERILMPVFSSRVVRQTLPFCLLFSILQARPGEALTPAQAQALCQRALNEELRMAEDSSHPMRYLLRKSSPRLTTTKEIAETHDGYVARLLQVNDRPLDAAGEQQEQARLDALLADPSLQRHRKHSEEGDSAIVLKLLRMLPEAFLYQDAGSAAGGQGRIEKFTFKPNPKFTPPDMETQALTAMVGEIWVDTAEQRVTHIYGTLQQDTNYGWGILGRLNKGGWMALDQANVGGGQWRITHVQLRMSLRIVFRNKIFDTDEQMSNYQPLPASLDYRQAIHLLRGR